MARRKLTLNPLTRAREVRFHALAQILGVSINTVYEWRRGTFKKTPPLPVVVEPGEKKPEVWVDVEELYEWLSKYRPHLVEKLIEYLRRALNH